MTDRDIKLTKTTTYVSLGLVLSLIFVTGVGLNTINGISNRIASTEIEIRSIGATLTRLETKITKTDDWARLQMTELVKEVATLKAKVSALEEKK